ncbi:MAG: hypothetical protein WAU03_03840 [Candidatus Saccharimonas aalborgensis]
MTYARRLQRATNPGGMQTGGLRNVTIVFFENRGWVNGAKAVKGDTGHYPYCNNVLMSQYVYHDNFWCVLDDEAGDAPAIKTGGTGSHTKYLGFVGGSRYSAVSDIMIAANPGQGVIFDGTNPTDGVKDGESLLSLMDAQGVKWAAFLEQLDAPGVGIGDMTNNGGLYMARHNGFVSDFAAYNIGSNAATRYGYGGSAPNGSYVMDAGSTGSFGGLAPAKPTWPNWINELNKTDTNGNYNGAQLTFLGVTSDNQGHPNGVGTGSWYANDGSGYNDSTATWAYNPDKCIQQVVTTWLTTKAATSGKGNLFIIWDEGGDRTGLPATLTDRTGRDTPFFLVSDKTHNWSGGRAITAAANHYGILADLQDFFGVYRPGQSGSARYLGHASEGVGIGHGSIAAYLDHA